MLGVQALRNAATVSTGSAAKIVGEVSLINFYNDGNKGTGTAEEMAIAERTSLAFEGIVVVALDVYRAGASGVSSESGGSLRCRCRLTTRGMWTDKGNLLGELQRVTEGVVSRLSFDATLAVVERQVIDSVRKACKTYNSRTPEVIVIAHENDPRAAHIPEVAAGQQQRWAQAQARPQQQPEARGRGASSPPPSFSKPWERSSATKPAAVARTPDEQSEGEATSGSSDESHAFTPVPEGPPSTAAAAEPGLKRDLGVKQQLLDARKRAVESRKAAGGPPSSKRVSGPQEGSGPPSEPLPEGVLEKRKRMNPRDQPSKENDTDYG